MWHLSGAAGWVLYFSCSGPGKSLLLIAAVLEILEAATQTTVLEGGRTQKRRALSLSFALLKDTQDGKSKRDPRSNACYFTTSLRKNVGGRK